MTCNRKSLSKSIETIGDRLRFWRKRAGLTQKQLAVKTRLPRWRIQRVETDEILPNQDEITAIGCALGIAEAVLKARGQH